MRRKVLKPNNLFTEIPETVPRELFETLLSAEHFTLERIVSSGQATSSGAWYDQDTHEWVLLLQGGAGLVFEGEAQTYELQPGDFVHIPAHQRHRVAWTQEKTVWLALHYRQCKDTVAKG